MQSGNQHILTDAEVKCQKSLVTFCKTLPVHIEIWKKGIQDFAKPVKVLANLSEQLRCIEKIKFRTTNADLEIARGCTKALVLHQAEYEIPTINSILDKLTKANSDLKNKLIIFESSTIKLDWDESYLVKGTAFQPPLGKLLKMGHDYSDYFGNLLRKINLELRGLDYRDEAKMEQFQKCFDISFDANENDICHIIAVTQYVDNTQNVI